MLTKKDKEQIKYFLKQRTPLACSCKKSKGREKIRARYGVNTCDGFSFNYSVGLILSNALFQYLADAKIHILRDDWNIIEKHAKAIKEFAEADSWDKVTVYSDKNKDALTRMFEYDKKEVAWREAMFWLTENWEGLWW